MKYYRLSFRSQDRKDSSTYSSPKFFIQLPSNSFGNTRGGTCKVVLEQFDGYANKQSSKAYDQVCIEFKYDRIHNAVQTLGVNDFGASRGLGFVPSVDRRANEVYYHRDLLHTDALGTALIVPCATFERGTLEFELKHIDGTAITAPSSNEFKFYTFCLGVYVEEDE